VTTPPLPDVPCLRVRLSGTDTAGNTWGTRFYLSYAGSAPTGANCVTLAGDIEAAFASDLAPLMGDAYSLTEVDVLDIATDSGLSGQWTGDETGSRSGNNLPAQVCMNVEYGIARRYRGGKPRGFWPFGVVGDEESLSSWSSAFVGDVNSGISAFFTAVEALSVGAVGALRHVNLSYYEGFTNHANTSGRERAVPTYRATALHDNVTSYAAKIEYGSQRRRRTSTTP
jgi:hypothetical protein